MVGAIVFGYLGGSLKGALAPILGDAEGLPGPITLVGLVAFGLGAIGFGVACWYFPGRNVLRQAQDERSRESGAQDERGRESAAHGELVEPPSYQPDGWVRAIAEAGYTVSRDLSKIQSGVLPR